MKNPFKSILKKENIVTIENMITAQQANDIFIAEKEKENKNKENPDQFFVDEKQTDIEELKAIMRLIETNVSKGYIKYRTKGGISKRLFYSLQKIGYNTDFTRLPLAEKGAGIYIYWNYEEYWSATESWNVHSNGIKEKL